MVERIYSGAFIVVWLYYGLLAWGAAFARWQTKYADLVVEDYWQDLAASAVGGILSGPFGLLWVLAHEGDFTYGFRWF